MVCDKTDTSAPMPITLALNPVALSRPLMTRPMPKTMLDKLWDAHRILESGDRTLLWVDRHFVHEGSNHAFKKITDRGLKVRSPERTYGIADHYVPIRDRARPAPDPRVQAMIDTLTRNCREHGVTLFGLEDPRQGIVHVVGPEQGITLPGLLIVCGDSHTATHGALGAFAFGIGASEVAHVLATQTLWQRKPKALQLRVDGGLAPGVGAKDIALTWIAKFGASAAAGHAIEYCGSTIRGLSVEARMTLCNLSIEGGARSGMIAPDETLLTYLRDRPAAPMGAAFDPAAEHWMALGSDEDARFDARYSLNAEEVAPIVTWGTSPEDALPISQTVPDPRRQDDPQRAQRTADGLTYMGLSAGAPLESVPIDRVFIGSCTNARIEDLRDAAAILAGRKSRVPGIIAPGSSLVRVQAEQEGLDRIFIDAGLEWSGSGCSMCVGMNGDVGLPGERIASSTNRNFKGRQGPGVRTHLMSPAMVAAAAVTGHLTDVRRFLMKGAA